MLTPPLWVQAATFNSFAAGFVLWQTTSVGVRRSLLVATAISMGFMVLILSNFIHPLSPLAGKALLVGWVPVVEEIVFRLGVSPFLQQRSGSVFLGCYGTAAIFSLLHSLPSLLHDGTLNSQLMLAPFVLSIFCEALYRWKRIFLLCVILHSVGNGVAINYPVITRHLSLISCNS